MARAAAALHTAVRGEPGNMRALAAAAAAGGWVPLWGLLWGALCRDLRWGVCTGGRGCVGLDPSSFVLRAAQPCLPVGTMRRAPHPCQHVHTPGSILSHTNLSHVHTHRWPRHCLGCARGRAARPGQQRHPPAPLPLLPLLHPPPILPDWQRQRWHEHHRMCFYWQWWEQRRARRGAAGGGPARVAPGGAGRGPCGSR